MNYTHCHQHIYVSIKPFTPNSLAIRINKHVEVTKTDREHKIGLLLAQILPECIPLFQCPSAVSTSTSHQLYHQNTSLSNLEISEIPTQPHVRSLYDRLQQDSVQSNSPQQGLAAISRNNPVSPVLPSRLTKATQLWNPDACRSISPTCLLALAS
jgi:hypothetical protein